MSQTIERSQPVLSPALKAAFCVTPFVVGLELLSSLLPGIGYLLGLPISVVVYFCQGALAAWFLQGDELAIRQTRWNGLRQALVSAIWSGLVISAIVTAASLLVETLVTAGTALVAAPAILTASAVDLGLNLIFCVVGAWVFISTGKTGLMRGSCILFGLGTGGLLLAILSLWAAVTGGALGYLVHHVLQGH